MFRYDIMSISLLYNNDIKLKYFNIYKYGIQRYTIRNTR